MIIALSIFFLPSHLLFAQGASHREEHIKEQLLDLYLEQAERAFTLGFYDEAWRILLLSDEFRSDYHPEYLHLKGRMLMQKGAYQQAKVLFEELLAKGDLLAIGELHLYEIYLRHQNYSAIKALFAKGLLQNSDAFFYQQLALFYTNDKNFRSFSIQAMRRFNHDARFILPLLVSGVDNNSHFAQLNLLYNIMRQDYLFFEDMDLLSQDITLAMVRRLAPAQQGRVLHHLEPWLANNINYHLMVRQQIALGDDSFLDPRGNYQAPHWEQLEGNYLLTAYLTSLEDEALLASKLAWAEDRNLDGFAELVGTVNAQGNGMMRLSPTQDDFSSIEVMYQRFQPQRVVEAQADREVEIVFSYFPQVDKVYARDTSVREGASAQAVVYHLRFDAITLSPWLDQMSIGESRIPHAMLQYHKPMLLDRNLVEASAYVDELRGDWHFRRMRVVDGEILHIWEDSDNVGYFNRFLKLNKGVIEYGRRAFSAYDDFLLLEIYEKNEVVGVAFSEDGSNFDFYEEEQAGYRLQVWDIDVNDYINVYRKINQPPTLPREQRVWLRRPVRVDAMTARDFASAKRWLKEVY